MKRREKTLGATSNGLDPGRAAALAADLAAARAEATAQLDVALATLADLEAAPPCPALPDIVPDVLREAARELIEATAEADDAERFAAALPPGPDVEVLDAAEQAQGDAAACRAELPPAWRRTAGALISATGMAIVIAALGLDAWVYLVPAVLVVVITADLRAAAAAWRAATARANDTMAAAGLADRDELPAAQARARTALAARSRAEEAVQRRDEATVRWNKLAPGTAPEDVETLLERLTDTQPVVDREAERARTLASRLVEEARAELERIDRESAGLGSFL